MSESGTAIAAFALASVVLNRLRSKGILDQAEIVEVLDQCMLVMETLGLDSAARKHAHSLIETTLQGYGAGARRE